MNETRGKEVLLDTELHFDSKDELPERERIDPAVRIVRIRERGELLIERDLDDPTRLMITAGGLSLCIGFDDFLRELCCMFRDEPERWVVPAKHTSVSRRKLPNGQKRGEQHG